MLAWNFSISSIDLPRTRSPMTSTRLGLCSVNVLVFLHTLHSNRFSRPFHRSDIFRSSSPTPIMAGTRSSSRLSASSPASSQGLSPQSRKRKASASASPQSKTGRKDHKEQKTIEETLPDEAMTEAAEAAETSHAEAAPDAPANHSNEPAKDTTDNAVKGKQHSEESTQGGSDAKDGDSSGQTTKMDSTGKLDNVGEAKAGEDSKHEAHGTVETTQERKDKMPSNILEKGMIYFFTRGRVGVDEVEGAQDIARSYIVLRPLPNGAKLNGGAIEDLKNNRLLALPKKVLPKSHRDTFMTFVEKAGATIQELKDDFMKGSEYNTKTSGVRSTPAVTPIGEGVYALTTTGRDSHMAYMLTIPSKIGEVQEEMGLKQQGSFYLSTKNPARAGPANSNLPQGPQFPQE